jgi:signal transduction histidine kinase
MNRAKTQQSDSRAVVTGSEYTRLSGTWLIIARTIWLVLVVPSLGLFVIGLPAYAQQVQKPCADATTCNIAGALTATGLRGLIALGFSTGEYAAFLTIFWVIIIAIWSVIGFLIFWRRSDEWFALLAAFALLMFNLTYPGLSSSALSISHPFLNLAVTLIGLLGQLSFALFFLLFPNGRLIPRWVGLIIPLIIIQAISIVLPPTSPFSQNSLPSWLNGLLSVAVYGMIIFSQIYRYRRMSTLVERLQTKWVAFAIASVATGFLVFGLLFNVFFPQLNQPDNPDYLITLVYPLFLLLIPVSVGFAILRYRLWDIDIIIKRTLVYGLLTAFVIGIYVLVVGYLGAIFHTRSSLVISLLATGLVAVLFQPLRDLLQRGINRLLYGLRDEPYVVLAGLGQRLKTTLDPDVVLSTIVVTVREALKLSYAAIEAKEGSAFTLAASSGTPPTIGVVHLLLVYQGELVGRLLIAPHGRDDTLSPADLRLLNDLAHQVGAAVHNVRLTSDLRTLTLDLQRSREHLVSAREEERRRLRRDLHDGLGPMLSAIMLKVGLVRNLYHHDPHTTDTLLNQLEAEIESVIGDIRRLVYNLRPPALDELGLVGAIRDYVTRLSTGGQAPAAAFKVTVEAPETLPALPAAVEVAAYRIVQEAVTNVIRHAHAHSCCVRLQVKDALQIEVSDDGKGIDEAERTGVGRTSMRERAEELGGTLTIMNITSGGTQVMACLPLLNVIQAETSA